MAKSRHYNWRNSLQWVLDYLWAPFLESEVERLLEPQFANCGP